MKQGKRETHSQGGRQQQKKRKRGGGGRVGKEKVYVCEGRVAVLIQTIFKEAWTVCVCVLVCT